MPAVDEQALLRRVVAVPRSRGRRPEHVSPWWAVLFTLSMLARYQPAEWAAHVNVDAARTPSLSSGSWHTRSAAGTGQCVFCRSSTCL